MINIAQPGQIFNTKTYWSRILSHLFYSLNVNTLGILKLSMCEVFLFVMLPFFKSYHLI